MRICKSILNLWRKVNHKLFFGIFSECGQKFIQVLREKIINPKRSQNSSKIEEKILDYCLIFSEKVYLTIFKNLYSNLKGVPNDMKGVFEGLLHKNDERYKLIFSMTGMT
jgi:predicted transcriptional regulator with HTH domain